MTKKKCLISYSDIVSLENLFTAWKEFVKGKRGKQDVQEFQLCLADNILALHRDLVNKTYRHGPYEHFTVTDPKRRDIHKASVRDRLVHHAVHRQLYPYFDRLFISDVYSSRVGKGTHKAMDQLRRYSYTVSKNHTRTCWVLKCDIRKFFASVDHEILLTILAKHIPDPDILWLLNNIITSFSANMLCEISRLPDFAQHIGIPRYAQGWGRNGLPLGNLTSQLLVNVYMNEFDHFVKSRLSLLSRGSPTLLAESGHTLRAKHYIRYADDFILLHHDRGRLQEICRYIVQFLHTRLKLSLHPDKLSIRTLASGVDFLGWVHFSDHRVLRTVTKRRMFKRISAHPITSTVASYLGLLSHGNAGKLEARVMLK